MIPGLRNHSIEARLKKLHLWSLEERRNRSDIIDIFKMFKCISAIPFETFFRPYLKKDIDLLEKVQRRATRLMTSDKSLSYTDRLQKFGLTTLETRRLRGDLIEVFKMFKGFDNIALNDFFKLSSTTLRGHTLKIYKPQVHLDVKKFFFTVRIRRME